MEGNAAFIAMAGPARALDTIGGQVAWQATAFGAIVGGLMACSWSVRHTRAEEESGRDELLRAAAVGRRADDRRRCWSPCVANVLLGALVALSLLIAYGLAAAGLARRSGVGLAAVRAGLRGTSRCSPPSSPAAPARRTASPAP